MDNSAGMLDINTLMPLFKSLLWENWVTMKQEKSHESISSSEIRV
jgi:hypothetical protein